MGQAVLSILGFAVGIAVSPVPVIAVILMLFSRRARVNGPLFLLGWAAALTVVGTAGYLLAGGSGASSDQTAADGVAWGKTAFGVLFLVLAVRAWRRQRGSSAPDEPAWMARVDAMAPAQALGLGALLAGVNPKNLMLALAAGATLATLGPTTGSAVVSLVVFVVVASLTIAGPVGYSLAGGTAAAARLEELRGWLVVHNSAVMMVLFVLLGVDLLVKGLAPLL